MFKSQYVGWQKVYNILGVKIKQKYKPQNVDEININFEESVGIGNRIFGLVNIINYFNPKKINLYWADKGWVSDKLCNLFRLSIDTVINEINDFEEFEKLTSKDIITIQNPPCDLRTLSGDRLAFLYNEINEQDMQEITKYFRNIFPSNVVEERISKVSLSNNCVAIQVRNNKDWNEWGRDESLDLFCNEIDKYDFNTVFYLSAMNKNISDLLKNKYPNRIIELPNKNYLSMIDAVADLYLLSRCKSAVYSYGSTFAELAFWLNGAKQQVIMLGDDSKWKSYKEVMKGN